MSFERAEEARRRVRTLALLLAAFLIAFAFWAGYQQGAKHVPSCPAPVPSGSPRR